MQAESLGEEHGHLTASDRIVHAEVSVPVAARDARGVQGLHELKERMVGRHVGKRRRRRRGAHRAVPPDLHPAEIRTPPLSLIDVEHESVVSIARELPSQSGWIEIRKKKPE